MKQFIIVWHNCKNNTYYYKISKLTYFNYCVGYSNQYGHVVVLIIPFNSMSFLDRLKQFVKKSIKRLIRFLDKLQKRI